MDEIEIPIVPTVLYTTASADLAKEVEEELSAPDPDHE
jgi:hypothetical protein